jgi:hypothetical protein
LFSEKNNREQKQKKGQNIFTRASLSLLERPDQSTTTTPVLSYATTTTHRKARPNHSLATHRPSFSPFSLSLLDAQSLTLLCSTRRLDSISGDETILTPCILISGDEILI